MDVVNLRGIFKLPIVRNILDKLIHIEDQPTINKHMGQYQVGNQTGRGIRDHTFILHAAIHEPRSRNIEVDFLFTDINNASTLYGSMKLLMTCIAVELARGT